VEEISRTLAVKSQSSKRMHCGEYVFSEKNYLHIICPLINAIPCVYLKTSRGVFMSICKKMKGNRSQTQSQTFSMLEIPDFNTFSARALFTVSE